MVVGNLLLEVYQFEFQSLQAINGYLLYGKRLKREICFRRNEILFYAEIQQKIHLFKHTVRNPHFLSKIQL